MLVFIFEQAAKYSHKLWSCSLLTVRDTSGGNTGHFQFHIFYQRTSAYQIQDFMKKYVSLIVEGVSCS